MNAVLDRLRVCFLPPSPAHCTAGDAGVNAKWERRLQRKRVLVVDDDPLLFELLIAEVETKLEAHLESADSVKTARERLARESFDCVILDYRLTNGTGVELYRELVRCENPPQVVFLTGNENPMIAREVEKIGPARVYSKDRVLDRDFIEALFRDMGIGRDE